VKYYGGTLSKTHVKTGERNAEIKDRFVDMIQNDLLHEFIDKKFVSSCNRFSSRVAATAGH